MNQVKEVRMRDHVKGGALTEVTFYILLSLYSPRHGYAVMQFIEEETGGRLALGAGTLYGALNSLQEKGWIEFYDSKVNGDGRNRGTCEERIGRTEGKNYQNNIRSGTRKKAYIITPEGKAAAEKELERIRELEKVAVNIIRGGAL